MKYLALLASIGAAATPAVASAQLVPGTPYVLSSANHTYAPLINPTVLFTSALTSTADVNLPFPFRFYDLTYTAVSAGTDGAVVMGAGTNVSNVNATPGSTSTPNGFIAPFWDSSQFCAADNGSLGYQVQGVAPNRVIVFEWHRLNNGSCTPVELVSYQLRLYEGRAGRIEIDYGPSSGLTGAGVTATMAMEDEVGARPILFRNCTTSCTEADYAAVMGTRLTLVQDPGVDVEAVDVAGPRFIPLGVARTVSVTVQNNNGAAVGPLGVDVLASVDGTVQNATLTGTASVSIAPYSSETITVDIVAPLALGARTYELIAVVDSQGELDEVDEENNLVISSQTVRFLPPDPDLAVRAVSIDRGAASEGDTVQITARIANIGGAQLSAVDVAAYLSTNPAVSAVDLELARTTVTVASGEEETVTIAGVIPAGIASGRYTVGVVVDPARDQTELSRSNNVGAAGIPLDVTGAGIAIITTRIPNAQLEAAYNAVIQILGEDGAVEFSVVSGALPDGISIASTGDLFGRPTTVGCGDVTIRVQDDVGSDEQMFTICVVDPAQPLTIVSRAVPIALVGQEFFAPLVATGGEEEAMLEWTGEGFPPGLSIQSAGNIVGTPQEAGTFDALIRVSDGTSMAERTIAIEVGASNRLTLTSTVLPPARIGEPYSHQFEATGGLDPLIFTADFGRIPSGLTLTPDGLLEGTPRVAGSAYFGVRVRDAATATDVDGFTLEIAGDGALIIETTTLPESHVDAGYDASITASGGLAPYTWRIAEGTLPPGLVSNVDSTTGELRIVGTPEELGTFSLLVEVNGAEGRSAQRAFAIRVVEAPVVDTTEPGGCVCVDDRGTGASAALLVLFAFALVRRRRA